MPVPPAADAGMLLLGGIVEGYPLRTDDGRLAVDVPGHGPEPVPAAVLDELEAKGWLDLSGEQPLLTETGWYWLRRWLDRHDRKRKRAG